jgi:hypothetical protein
MSSPADKSGERAKPAGNETRFAAPRPVSALVAPLTRRALGKHGFSSASLVSDWTTIVGGELAAGCQPEKLAFPPGRRDRGTLHLRVSGGAALEIQHVAPQIIERINGHLGYHAVERLRMTQGPVARPPGRKRRQPLTGPPRRSAERLDPALLDTVSDPTLRESLERLGAAIAARESRGRK